MSTESAQQHIRVVALLTLAGGVLALVPALIVLVTGGALFAAGGMGFSGEGMLAGGIVGIVGFFLLLLGLPSIIAGFGLLARKRWARPLTIVLSLFNIFAFPVGTALAAYQLWVLALNHETVAAYKGAAEAPRARDYA